MNHKLDSSTHWFTDPSTTFKGYKIWLYTSMWLLLKLLLYWKGVQDILQKLIFVSDFLIFYRVHSYSMLLHFLPRMIWTRHWCERNKIHFQSLRITVFQNHKMTDWHFHTTHQIPIISVLKAALQLVWKRLSLDVQKHYFPPLLAAECNITLEIHSSLSASKSSAVRLASEYSLMCDSGCESERERANRCVR